MKEIAFTKMHGAGNDYIYIYCPESIPDNIGRLAVKMSDRHFGIGGDGIVLILPGKDTDFKMRMFNADGSEAQMCGNASRCVGKYVYDNGLTNKTLITLDTLAGVKILDLHIGKDLMVNTVTVDMGMPETEALKVPVKYNEAPEMIEAPVETSAGTLNITAVSMGNPHGVIFVDDLDSVFSHPLGRELEINPIWPEKANIEFAQLIDPENIRMRVWERGSGETLACGTGACATAVAAFKTGRAGRKVTLHLLGGNLDIEIADNGHVMMTGGATTVFNGVYFDE